MIHVLRQDNSLKTAHGEFGTLDGRDHRSIGRALAVELAGRGYALGLTARRIALLETFRDELQAKHGKGHIVGVSSLASVQPVASQAAYCASKADLPMYLNAARKITRLIARRVKSGIVPAFPWKLMRPFLGHLPERFTRA